MSSSNALLIENAPVTERPFAHFNPPIRRQSPLRQAVTRAYRSRETNCVAALLPSADFPSLQEFNFKEGMIS